MPALHPPGLRTAHRAAACTTASSNPNIKRQLGVRSRPSWRRSPWLAGDAITAADVMMSFPMEAAKGRVGFGARPKLAAWLDRIHARPAYRAALARGGPYAYAG